MLRNKESAIMIEDIVLTKDEFRALDLRMVGNYASSIIYAGDAKGIRYLLKREHDEIVGTFYTGSKLTMLEPIHENHIKSQIILLDIKETAEKHKGYLQKRRGKWDGVEE